MTEAIEHYASVLASGVEISQGHVTLHGLCDMVDFAGDLPADGLVGVHLVLMSSWRRWCDPGVYFRQRVMLEFDEGGGTWGPRVQVGGPDDIDLVARHLAAVLSGFTALPLNRRGQYRFVIEREIGDFGSNNWVDAPPTVGLWVPPRGQWPLPPDTPRARLKAVVRDALAGTGTEMLTTDVLQYVRADDFPEFLTTIGAEVYHALNDLRRSGDVESTGPGRWRLMRR